MQNMIAGCDPLGMEMKRKKPVHSFRP